jgi:hypothetical protein
MQRIFEGRSPTPPLALALALIRRAPTTAAALHAITAHSLTHSLTHSRLQAAHRMTLISVRMSQWLKKSDGRAEMRAVTSV